MLSVTFCILVLLITCYTLWVLLAVVNGVVRRKGLDISVKKNILKKHVCFILLKLFIYMPRIITAFYIFQLYFLQEVEMA